MIIVDSNIIIQCFKNRRSLPSGDLIVPDDLNDEYAVAKEIHGRDIPGMILASQLSGYDEVYYLKKYFYYLNSYSEVYFVQMRGFADVSILALTACLADNFGTPKQQALFSLGVDSDDVITVATQDGPLREKLQSEFGNQINIIGYEDI
jgi:hypothetical protein